MPSKPFSEESRKPWVKAQDAKPEIEDLKFGALQRIATATETMAKEHDRLIRERDFYKERWAQERDAREALQHQNRGLRGAVTRFKRELREAREDRDCVGSM